MNMNFLQKRIISGFNLTVSTLGTPMVWKKTFAASPEDFLSSGTSFPLGNWNDSINIPFSHEVIEQETLGGFKTVGKDDMDIINAYGIETRIVTLSKSYIKFIPAQFDTFLINGFTYVTQAVHEMYVNGISVGYKCYVKGAQ